MGEPGESDAERQVTVQGLQQQHEADQVTIGALRQQHEADLGNLAQLRSQAEVDQALLAELLTQSQLDRHEIAHLEIALVSARRIGAALGIVMAHSKVDEHAAFEVLRDVSQNSNRKLRDVAEDILYTGTLHPPTVTRPS